MIIRTLKNIVLAATLTISAVAFFVDRAYSEDIYGLIVSGQLDKAHEMLSQLSTAQKRDGNYLFYLSLIEPKADKAIDLMEASLKSGVAAIYRDEINNRLTQYYLLKKDYDKAGPLIADYLIQFENGRYRPEFFRYSVLMDEKEGRYETAIKQIDRYLLHYDSKDLEQIGEVDKARLMMAFDKMIAARDILKKLTHEKSGAGVPLALYLLNLDASNRNRTDDAVFYYNILRDGYPSSVGLDALLDRMSGLSSNSQREKSADKRTGTYYSVQVGVFASAENAKKLAKEFEKYGQKVDIRFKEISDRTYNVVYVGRFDSYEAAASFEKKLEADENGVYQVVAR